jgi:hypothetical protein
MATLSLKSSVPPLAQAVTSIFGFDKLLGPRRLGFNLRGEAYYCAY